MNRKREDNTKPESENYQYLSAEEKKQKEVSNGKK